MVLLVAIVEEGDLRLGHGQVVSRLHLHGFGWLGARHLRLSLLQLGELLCLAALVRIHRLGARGAHLRAIHVVDFFLVRSTCVTLAGDHLALGFVGWCRFACNLIDNLYQI